ncbi:MAG: replication-relaxation family protein [Acidobacteria bacterium]|nr:replication-relaxation family protein [Acidobacteriota bacterium]
MPLGKNSRPGLDLQARDLAIFQGLFESRLMTLDHITRLYFDGRPEAAKKRIQGLKSARYLGERTRRVYEKSILHLREPAFVKLSASGKISEYPIFTWKQLYKRLQVSDSTLRHELDVLNVKTSLSCAIRALTQFELLEFSTWPLIYQFEAAQPPRLGAYQRAKVLIRPDGFVRLYEHTNGDDAHEHFLFLEVDRSTEPHETLALRTYGYQDYYRRGGLAVRYGASPEDYREYPFRVLMVVPNDERRNNMAERLLQNTPPILSMVWLTTFAEITTDPLGAIWMRPRDYREITKGTAYDPSRPRTGAYRRQPEREALVAGELKKSRLFEEDL